MHAKLGQHFLKNRVKIDKVIESLEPKNEDAIIEIGPGHGELTEHLIAKLQNLENSKVIAIEKDENLYKNLVLKYKNIKFLKGDALKILPAVIHDQLSLIGNYKIIGNIPYYITGKLLRILGELEKKPEITVLMIQKEVAERICAKPGKMNLLAAAVQFWAKVEIIDHVPRRNFSPPPEVDSAIIKLVTKDTKQKKGVVENYYKLIKALFKQPRKTILNNLIALGSKKDISVSLEKLKIDPSARPQNLSLEIIEKISLSEIFN